MLRSAGSTDKQRVCRCQTRVPFAWLQKKAMVASKIRRCWIKTNFCVLDIGLQWPAARTSLVHMEIRPTVLETCSIQVAESLCKQPCPCANKTAPALFLPKEAWSNFQESVVRFGRSGGLAGRNPTISHCFLNREPLTSGWLLDMNLT